MLDQLTSVRDDAKAKLAKAEIKLLEATVATEALRENSGRLDAAVAALAGETPSAALIPPLSLLESGDKNIESAENNPLAQIKCTGCGRRGTLQDTIITAANGAQCRMMVCTRCKNQVMT